MGVSFIFPHKAQGPSVGMDGLMDGVGGSDVAVAPAGRGRNKILSTILVVSILLLSIISVLQHLMLHGDKMVIATTQHRLGSNYLSICLYTKQAWEHNHTMSQTKVQSSLR